MKDFNRRSSHTTGSVGDKETIVENHLHKVKRPYSLFKNPFPFLRVDRDEWQM